MKTRFEYRVTLLAIILIGMGFAGNKVHHLVDFLYGVTAVIVAFATLLLINELLPANERYTLIQGRKLRRLRERINQKI